MSRLRIITGIFLILGGGSLVIILQVGSRITFHNDSIDPATFISLILTALGVILAALALFIGVLAVIGWATFEGKIRRSSNEFLEKRFSTDDDRYVELISEIKQDVRRQIMASQKTELPENENPFSEDVQ